MSETLRDIAVRMASCAHGGTCDECPVSADLIDGNPCVARWLYKIENADAQIDALKKWASEHPRKTWIDLLREKLPDSEYVRDHNLHPSECPMDCSVEALRLVTMICVE